MPIQLHSETVIEIAKKIVGKCVKFKTVAEAHSVSLSSVKKVGAVIRQNNIGSEEALHDFGYDNFYRQYQLVNKKASKLEATCQKLTPIYSVIAERIKGHSDMSTEYIIYCNECAKAGLGHVCRTDFYEDLKKAKIEYNERSGITDKELAKKAYLPQEYKPGQYVMCDHSGLRFPVVTPEGVQTCYFFAICWPFSNYADVQIVTSQTTLETCQALAVAFKRFGCLPMVVKHDNAKMYVTSRKDHEVVFNDTFKNFLQNLNIVPQAAMPYRGSGKSQAEALINTCQTRIYNLIKDELSVCRSLEEHNEKLYEYVQKYINQAPFKNDKYVTREYLFLNKEKVKARPLTVEIPEVSIWRHSIRVPRTYRIKEGNHFYSVPYQYIDKYIDMKVTSRNVIFYDEGKPIATHVRVNEIGASILEEHMTTFHQKLSQKQGGGKFKTEQDIYDVAESYSQYLLAICKRRYELARIEYPDNEYGLKYAKQTCIAIINLYSSKAYRRELLDECCKSILILPRKKITVYLVRELYQEILAERKQNGHYSVQTALMFDPEDEGGSDTSGGGIDASFYDLRDERDVIDFTQTENDKSGDSADE